jgi:hypothetical protein
MEFNTSGTQKYAFKGRGALNRLEPVLQGRGKRLSYQLPTNTFSNARMGITYRVNAANFKIQPNQENFANSVLCLYHFSRFRKILK